MQDVSQSRRRAEPVKKQLSFEGPQSDIDLQPKVNRSQDEATCDGFDAWTNFSKNKQNLSEPTIQPAVNPGLIEPLTRIDITFTDSVFS